jgi:RNA polymerase sigma-70 factor (ECF subfamily)
VTTSPGAATVTALYERALGDVYGYLVRRCPDRATAEDLTSETFLAAARAAGDGTTELTVAWLIGTARHKLIDQWRRAARGRRLVADHWSDDIDGADGAAAPDPADPVEALHVRDVLARMSPEHRAALVLRYLDGLPVPEVAWHLDRSVHATESLLVRARASYRAVAAGLGDEQAVRAAAEGER